MPEYDETGETIDEQSSVATADTDESVEAASDEPADGASEPTPAAGGRRGLRPGRRAAAEAALRAGRLVRGALLRRLREQGQDQPRDPDHQPRHGGVHLPGRGADPRRGRGQERQAAPGAEQGLPGLHPGPDGAHAGVVLLRAQHPRGDRLRRRDRPGRPSRAAVARRGAEVAGPGGRDRGPRSPSPRSRSSTSRSATRSPSPTARSPRCRRRSARSTPTSRSSRCWCRSSVARPRSSSTSTRSRRSKTPEVRLYVGPQGRV